jgi:trimeric autotransporter adhesin
MIRNFLLRVSFLSLVWNAANAQNNYVATSPSLPTPGTNNTLVGIGAGNTGMSGSLSNVLVGRLAGSTLGSGSFNTLLGVEAGKALSTGSLNTFVGFQAGLVNTSSNNTFVGSYAGTTTSTGDANVFVGYEAGRLNQTGTDNVFVGFQSGNNNTGGSNTFLGSGAGDNNTTGSSNTYLGINAKGGATLTNASAIGAGAYVKFNNSLVLGDTSNVNVGIGTAHTTQRFNIRGNVNFLALGDGLFMKNRKFLFQDEQDNVILGLNHEVQGQRNTLIGANTKAIQVQNATVLGYGATATANNVVILGGSGAQAVNVGIGNSAPGARLEITAGAHQSGLRFSNLTSDSPASQESTQFLTVNAQGDVQLAQLPKTLSYQVEQKKDWADHVLATNYALLPIEQVQQFIAQNGHLPGVPSASEMTQNKMGVAQMDALLLKKIEELTLYVISLKKENDQLKQIQSENQQIKDRLQQMERLISELSKK